MVGDVASGEPSLALLLGRRRPAALRLVVLARCIAWMCLRVVVVKRERPSQPLADVRPQLLQLVDELIAPCIAIHFPTPERVKIGTRWRACFGGNPQGV
jgi:hypothetical protein